MTLVYQKHVSACRPMDYGDYLGNHNSDKFCLLL